MGLATNSPISFVEPALREVGLWNYFDAITTASEVTRRKPDPEIYEKTFSKLNVLPSETLVLEDQLIGIQAAEATGAFVIGIDNHQGVQFPQNCPLFSWKALLKI